MIKEKRERAGGYVKGYGEERVFDVVPEAGYG